MEELLQAYGSDSKIVYSVGDKVTGTITAIEKERVLLDIGAKTEGLVAEKVFKEAENLIKRLKVGDKIEAMVIVPETPEGYTVLTLRAAVEDEIWKKIKSAEESVKPVRVQGVSQAPAGLTVTYEGLSGFIPSSQIGKEASKNTSEMIGKTFDAVVIDFDRGARKIILSEKEVSEKEQLAEVREAMKQVSDGDKFDGVVTTIYDFGCFVKIKAPLPKAKRKIDLEGLVHVSELSWDKVKSPFEVASEGDKVKVVVIGKRNEKLALSMKQAQDDPWEGVAKKYKKDIRVKGKVVKVSDFGVFVQLEPGVEGLIHMTKIPPGKKLEEGQEVNVYVEEVDEKDRKISLGLVLTEKPVGYK